MTYATPPRPGSRPGSRRGGKFSRGGARGAPRPGAPGAPPGGPDGPPGRASRTPLLGGPIYIYLYYSGGYFGGYPGGCILGPPAGGPPGGPKSAHFFGYLITLPVGTVWAIFSGPGTARQDPHFGAYPGVIRQCSPHGPVFMWSMPSISRHHAQHALQARSVR